MFLLASFLLLDSIAKRVQRIGDLFSRLNIDLVAIEPRDLIFAYHQESLRRFSLHGEKATKGNSVGRD